MEHDIKQKIESLINANSVVLFMKGTKDRPQCGFSKQVVEALSRLINDFATVDVLADPQVREGIKVYSSWPTIPQLYIDGEFIGGCDIVLDMFKKNELQKLLNIKKCETPPKITILPAALEAFQNACRDMHEDEYIRLSIATDFEHGLTFDQKHDEDFVLKFDEIEIIIDAYSALRADGLSIDFVSKGLEEGFFFKNPNESPQVNEISVEEFKQWQEQGKDILLIDVRPKQEWSMAHISSAKLLCDLSEQEITSLKKDQTIVFHCHHGGRSRQCAESFRKKGFTNLYNLTGGIDAWSRKIDHTVPLYVS